MRFNSAFNGLNTPTNSNEMPVNDVMNKFQKHVVRERNFSQVHSSFICPLNIKRRHFLTPNLKLVCVMICLTVKVFRDKILTNKIIKLKLKANLAHKLTAVSLKPQTACL